MHEKRSFAQRAEEFLNGKGFYIVLFVCIAVIGVSAWLLLFSEFSPLNIGDDEDYLDVMADADNVSAPIDLRGENTDDKTGTTPESGPEGEKPDAVTEDKNNPAAKNETDEGALKLEEDTKANTPSDTAPEKTPEKAPESNPEAEPETGKDNKSTLKPEDITFMWPVYGEIAVSHSPAALIFDKTMGDWRTHNGIDIAAERGTKVMAAADGTVSEVGVHDLYGTTVIIDHGAGVKSIYSNLAATPTVKAGDSVTMGSVIGSVGDTALGETGEVSHLHFSMTLKEETADPADFLPRR